MTSVAPSTESMTTTAVVSAAGPTPAATAAIPSSAAVGSPVVSAAAAPVPISDSSVASASVAATASGASVPAATVAAARQEPLVFRGTWSTKLTYQKSNVVFVPEFSLNYRSRVDGNSGKFPPVCPDQWAVSTEEEDRDEGAEAEFKGIEFEPISRGTAKTVKTKAFAKRLIRQAQHSEQNPTADGQNDEDDGDDKDTATVPAASATATAVEAEIGSGLSARQRKMLAKKKKRGDFKDEAALERKRQELLEKALFADPRTPEQIKADKMAQKKVLKQQARQSRAMKRLGNGGGGTDKLMNIAGQFARKQGGATPENVQSMIKGMKGALPAGSKTNLDHIGPVAMKAAAKVMGGAAPSTAAAAPAPAPAAAAAVNTSGPKLKRPTALGASVPTATATTTTAAVPTPSSAVPAASTPSANAAS